MPFYCGLQIKMPSKKNTAKKKTIVFVGIGDNNVFTDALETFVIH